MLTLEDLIEQVVRLSLHTLRVKVILRVMFEVINRIIDRILNFFKKNRIQFRIFTSVQNINIMNQYATQWSDLLLFFLKLIESNASYYTLFIRYLRHLLIIKNCMKRIQTLKETLLVVNTKQLSFEDCLCEFVDDEENTLSYASNSFIRSLTL